MDTPITKRQPQTLGAIIKREDWRSITPTLSDEKNKEIAAYREKYGNWSNFYAKFSPKKQATFAEHPEGCYLGSSPVLIDIKHIYGKAQMREWLAAQFGYAITCFGKAFVGHELIERDKQTGEIIKPNPIIVEYINSLCINYSGIKLSEWMLFLFRFRCGRYGKVYGDLTPDYCNDAIKAFLKERNGEIDVYERRLKSKERKNEKQAVTYDEYLRMKEAGEIEEYKEISTDK